MGQSFHYTFIHQSMHFKRTSSFLASGNLSYLLLQIVLDPDQVQRIARPALDPNCLTDGISERYI